MTIVLRACASLAAAVLVLLGAAAAARGLGFEFGLGDVVEVARQKELAQDLERRTRTVRARNEGKQRVTAQVIEGRLTLLQAAAEFRRLQERLRAEGGGDDMGLDDLSDEGLSVNVLLWARAELTNDPRRDVRLGELEGEFAARFRHAPALDPEPPSESLAE
jgi:hypothetical protein